mmetsp:Transcript_8239/g.10913  ORF Transcript_8239/g.10913 Transcript_8239/m.10913 type:complete len:209 (+) Transcript_8239:38-664(+)
MALALANSDAYAVSRNTVDTNFSNSLAGIVAKNCLRFMDFGKSGTQLAREQQLTHESFFNIKAQVDDLQDAIEQRQDPALFTSKLDLLHCKMIQFQEMDHIFCVRTTLMFRWNWIHKMMEPIIQAMIYLNEFDLWSPEFKHFMQSGTGIAKISSQPLNSFLYRCRNHPAKTNRSKALTLLKQKRRTLKKWARADEIYCIQDITNQECE